MTRWLLALLTVTLFSVGHVSLLHAQSDQDKAKAVKLLAKGDKVLARGDRLMDRGKIEKALEDYEEALKIYNEAHDVFPSPKIYFPIALAEQKLGRFLESMNHYQTMLKEGEDFGDEVIKEVEASIEEVKKNLVALDLTVEQDGATISVDGKVVGTTPLDGPYWMAPGRHSYEISLEGHKSIEQQVDLQPGQVEQLQVRLDAIPVKVVKPEKTPRKIIEKPSGPSKQPMVISFGVAGAFFLGATTTAILAKGKQDRYTDENLSISAREKARRSGKSYAVFTDLMLVSGMAAAAYGTYYYYKNYKGEHEQGPKVEGAGDKGGQGTAMWVTPYAEPNGGGLAMGMTF